MKVFSCKEAGNIGKHSSGLDPFPGSSGLHIRKVNHADSRADLVCPCKGGRITGSGFWRMCGRGSES